MIINFLNTYVFGPALPVAVFSVGLIMSAKLKFFPLLKPKKTFAPLFRSSGTGNSPVKALSVALAGTLGVGNIAGVAGAISLGGPGAVFWMWMSALFASVLKFSETLLAVKYRGLLNVRSGRAVIAYRYRADVDKSSVKLRYSRAAGYGVCVSTELLSERSTESKRNLTRGELCARAGNRRGNPYVNRVRNSGEAAREVVEVNDRCVSLGCITVEVVYTRESLSGVTCSCVEAVGNNDRGCLLCAYSTHKRAYGS